MLQSKSLCLMIVSQNSFVSFPYSLYGRHMQANPEPPKKNNDKSKKISRKPLAAKNK